MLKHLIFIAITTGTLTSLQAKPKEQTRTKSGLKEDIGLQLKASIDECVNIQQRLSEVGAQTCQIQRQLMQQMEDLLENGPLFKGKSKEKLEKTLTKLTRATNQLYNCAHQIDTAPTNQVLLVLDKTIVDNQKQL